MSSFTEAKVTKTDRRTPNVFGRWGSRAYYRVEGLRYYIGYVGSSLWVEIEDNFETDFASVPWLLHWVFDRKRAAKSAAVHDKLREDERFSLLETNDIFHMAMEAEGTPWLQREIYAFFVRFNTSRVNHQPK